jgi:hypothetical protein
MTKEHDGRGAHDGSYLSPSKSTFNESKKGGWRIRIYHYLHQLYYAVALHIAIGYTCGYIAIITYIHKIS